MTPTIDELSRALTDFNDRVRLLRPLTITTVRGAVLLDRKQRNVEAWAKQAGIYVVINDDKVVYLGRALKGQGLATRLGEHLRSGPSPAVCSALNHGSCVVAIVSLEDDDAWLAPSLELLALKYLRGEGLLNKRRA